MSDFSKKAARDILEKGFAKISLEQALLNGVQAVFSFACKFFQQPLSEKLKVSGTEFAKHEPRLILEGYKQLGDEYSQSPDRPDLNDSFSVWQCNQGHPELPKLVRGCELHHSMTKVLDPCRLLANDILDALRIMVHADSKKIEAGEVSYIQINSYMPYQEKRAFLQDEHEDGQLVTIVKPTKPGLEIKVQNGDYSPVSLEESEMLVIPGSILELATGGIVKPLYHRVVNDRVTDLRQTFIYFVNPTIKRETRPWIVNDTNRDKSIRALTVHNSERFGLPSIEM